MKTRQRFTASFLSTRTDLHGEQFTKEYLAKMLANYQEFGEPSMMDLDHQTTLPPIGYMRATRIQKADDGEYELIGEGENFNDEDYIKYDDSEIKNLYQINSILSN